MHRQSFLHIAQINIALPSDTHDFVPLASGPGHGMRLFVCKRQFVARFSSAVAHIRDCSSLCRPGRRGGGACKAASSTFAANAALFLLSLCCFLSFKASLFSLRRFSPRNFGVEHKHDEQMVTQAAITHSHCNRDGAPQVLTNLHPTYITFQPAPRRETRVTLAQEKKHKFSTSSTS